MTELAFVLVAQGALLALILVVMESRYPLANRFLAGLLIALSLPMLARVLGTRVYKGHAFIGSLNTAAFLIGPFFYLYTRALVNRGFAVHPRHLLHGLPVLVITAATLGTPGLDRPTRDVGLVRIVAFLGLLSATSLTIYSSAALRHLGRYRRALLDQYSAIERISLDWLKVLAFIVLTSGVAIAVVNCLRLSGFIPSSGANALIVVPFSLVMFYAIAILGFRQSSVLLIGTPPELPAEQKALADHEKPDAAPTQEPEKASEQHPIGAHLAGTHPTKYERSGLDDPRAQRIWAKLEALMASEPLYLDPDLQLSTLAERLEVSPQTLSEVLSRIAASRFYDYINRLRVERAKQLLRDPACADISILDIALRAGFNTKSTFNKYFKQEVGQTPTAYRQASA